MVMRQLADLNELGQRGAPMLSRASMQACPGRACRMSDMCANGTDKSSCLWSSRVILSKAWACLTRLLVAFPVRLGGIAGTSEANSFWRKEISQILGAQASHLQVPGKSQGMGSLAALYLHLPASSQHRHQHEETLHAADLGSSVACTYSLRDDGGWAQVKVRVKRPRVGLMETVKCCNSIGQKAAIPCKGEARAALGLKRLLAALLLEDDDRPGACSTGTTHSDTADAEVGDAKHPLHAAALKVAKTSVAPCELPAAEASDPTSEHWDPARTAFRGMGESRYELEMEDKLMSAAGTNLMRTLLLLDLGALPHLSHQGLINVSSLDLAIFLELRAGNSGLLVAWTSHQSCLAPEGRGQGV
ncbi:MAG: hypothetical protein FRX49_00620 [Trebouxia sp. A1-2]|nr:MAG: hypothetical protein FRX49_00620 [Trebouxia sp. A1-2]